jgi:two-component system, LuxR family, response regulator FixJ
MRTEALEEHPLPVVVVVDDDPAVLSSLKFALDLEGFDVRLYSDPELLLSASDLPTFACLLVDQLMPGKTGLELLTELRSRDIHWPAILMTGHPHPAVRQRAAAAGIPLLEKPLLGVDLSCALSEASGLSRPHG